MTAYKIYLYASAHVAIDIALKDDHIDMVERLRDNLLKEKNRLGEQSREWR